MQEEHLTVSSPPAAQPDSTETLRGNLPPAHVGAEEELTGPMYFDKCSLALQRGDEDGAYAIVDEAAASGDALRRIVADGEDVFLFDDCSWFDVDLCFELYRRRNSIGGEADDDEAEDDVQEAN